MESIGPSTTLQPRFSRLPQSFRDVANFPCLAIVSDVSLQPPF
jgi:hypothetical protein